MTTDEATIETVVTIDEERSYASIVHKTNQALPNINENDNDSKKYWSKFLSDVLSGPTSLISSLSPTEWSVTTRKPSSSSRCLNSKTSRLLCLLAVFMAYNGFFLAAISYSVINHVTVDVCQGIGLLILATVLIYAVLIGYFLSKYGIGQKVSAWTKKRIGVRPSIANYSISVIYSLSFLVLAVFLIIDTSSNRGRFVSLAGIFLVLGIAGLFSVRPRKIQWRHVMTFSLTNVLVFLLLNRVKFVEKKMLCLNEKIEEVLFLGEAGLTLISSDLSVLNAIRNTEAFYILSRCLSVYILAFIFSMLRRTSAIDTIIRRIGPILKTSIGSSAMESLIMFGFLMGLSPVELSLLLGQSHLEELSNSELTSFMSICLSWKHNAEAESRLLNLNSALIFSKMLNPEDEHDLLEIFRRRSNGEQDEKRSKSEMGKKKCAAAFEAGFSSICTTTSVLVTAFATIATITSLIGALDALTVFCGSLFQVEAESCSLAFIFGRILQPFVWFFGVDWSESDMVSGRIGEHFFLLSSVINRNDGSLRPRTQLILGHFLGNGLNPRGAAMLLGPLITLAPKRRSEVMACFGKSFSATFLSAFYASSLVSLLLK